MRHGPHHGAQQSTSTGCPFVCTTSRSKVASVTTNGVECSPAVVAASFSPQRPHFASLVVSLLSSTRFFAPHLLQTTTCITRLFQSFCVFDSPLFAKFSQISDAGLKPGENKTTEK